MATSNELSSVVSDEVSALSKRVHELSIKVLSAQTAAQITASALRNNILSDSVLSVRSGAQCLSALEAVWGSVPDDLEAQVSDLLRT